MASGALFGNAGTRSQSKNLVEFKAGKMYMKGKMVHPDKRKGQVYVYQSDDSLMHFCWKDRTSGAVEDDLIIFPDDIEFKSVPQCTTGRVYILKFKSSSRKFFFWMQEPKNDKDEEHCRKVNEYLNNPPTPGSSRGGTGAGGLAGLPPELAAGLGDSDLQNLLGNMSQQQLMQLFGGMGMGGGIPGLLAGARPTSAQSTDSAQPLRVQSSPGTRVTESRPVQESQPPRPVTAAALPSQPASSVSPLPAVTTAPSTGGTTSATVTSSPATGGAATSGAGRPASSASAAIQLSDLQSILSGMAGGEEKPRETVDLSQALNPESIIPILANPDIQKQLLNFLPEGETLPRTEEEVRNTISSPQFQQAMNTFSMALASGQLGPLMSQFNLGEEAVLAAAQGDVEAFVKAMQGVEEKKGEEKMDEEKKE